MSDNSPRWPGTNVNFGAHEPAHKDDAGQKNPAEAARQAAPSPKNAETPASPAAPSSPKYAHQGTPAPTAAAGTSDARPNVPKAGQQPGQQGSQQAHGPARQQPLSSAEQAASTAFTKPVSPASGPIGAMGPSAGALSASAVKTPASQTSAGTLPEVTTTPEKSTASQQMKYSPRVRRTRRARLRLARLDPWSVMKTTFLFAIAFGIITVVVVAMLWTVLAGSGALDSLESMLATLFGDPTNEKSFVLSNYINTQRVLGLTVLIAAIDVVIITAVCTLGAFLYNLAATILGGLEVTLAED